VERIERLALRGSKIFTPAEIDTVEAFSSISEFLKSETAPMLERKKRRVEQMWNADIADRCRKVSGRKDLTIFFPEEEGYPPLLREIDPMPQVLFIKGQAEWLSSPELKIACVGSRKPSSYGKYVVQKIIGQLAERRVTIVSGLAYGIDVMAHLTAIEKGTHTIGVLGFGVDHIYPASNTVAFRKVEEQGCLVSEYLPWQKPEIYFFPERNRIISGLSQGVLVIEASKTSGSLITVQHALSQNRDVFAIPGSIQSALSEGTNGLIKKGAKLVTDAMDIVEEYPWLVPDTLASPAAGADSASLASEERAVYDLIVEGCDQFDSLAERTRYQASTLNRILTGLSLKGLVTKIGSQYLPGREGFV